MRVRLENRNGGLTWRGTLIAFARANAMQPWEVLELQEKLEQQGDVALPFDGEGQSTLYNESIERVRLPGLRQHWLLSDLSR